MHNTKQVILMTVIVILFLPVFVLAGTVDLPKTGQTTCYDSGGIVIACTGTGQDGDVQAGVAWPSPRFTVGIGTGADCVTDNLTGLMWVRSPGWVFRTWQQSLDYANGLSLCGYTDWRLPNVIELESLVNAGQSNSVAWLNTQGFSNVLSTSYWSSTSYAGGLGNAWIGDMISGGMFDYHRSFGGYVWPVRSGQAGVAQPWETGQTTCYDSGGAIINCVDPITGVHTGQDGDIQAGVVLPSPRFTVGIGTEADCVTDNLTGLMWSKNANLTGTHKTWQQALDYANNLTLCGYTDWRLPDKKELLSLIDFSRYNPALSSGHPFLNVQFIYNYSSYWSSTSLAYYYPNYAWFVSMWGGGMGNCDKSSFCSYVWPVRSGHSIKGSVIENDISMSNVTMTLNGAASATTTTAVDGSYSFTNLADGNYTLTPAMSNYNFTPPSRSVTLAGADATAQDFSVVQTWFEENDPAITYTGIWSKYACASCSAGGAKISNKTLAKADFSFTGTGIKWIVAKGPMMGKARVYLDGVNMGLVDLFYSVTLKYLVVLPKTGLTPGNHTLTLEVSGQKNTSSTGYYIDIDAFEVVP